MQIARPTAWSAATSEAIGSTVASRVSTSHASTFAWRSDATRYRSMRSLRERTFKGAAGGAGVGVVFGRTVGLGGWTGTSCCIVRTRKSAAAAFMRANSSSGRASGGTAAVSDNRRPMTWWESWFGEEYLDLYPHRDLAAARREAAFALAHLPTP